MSDPFMQSDYRLTEPQKEGTSRVEITLARIFETIDMAPRPSSFGMFLDRGFEIVCCACKIEVLDVSQDNGQGHEILKDHLENACPYRPSVMM